MSTLILPRRKFLFGLAGAFAVPAIVKASSLMRVATIADTAFYAPLIGPVQYAGRTWWAQGSDFWTTESVEKMVRPPLGKEPTLGLLDQRPALFVEDGKRLISFMTREGEPRWKSTPETLFLYSTESDL